MKRRWSSFALMASIAVTLVVLTGGCTGASEKSERADPPKPKTVVVEKTVEVKTESSTVDEAPSSNTTSDAAEVNCEVGQECDLGESIVTVTNAGQTQAITSMGETLEGDFVVVEFDYTYGGSTSVDLGEPPFQLSDGDGNTYSLDFEATSSYGIDNDRSLIYETVQPGVAAQGTAIFEVSPDAENFTLLIEDLVSPRANESAKIPLPNNEQLSSSSSEVTSQENPTADVTSLDSFISSYYEAVDREDWSATYSMLDSESRAVFTEDEWIQKQTARNSAASPSPLTSAVVNGVDGQDPDQSANVTLGYEDGTQETLDVPIRSENGEYKRYLTDDDIAYLEAL